jgi:isopentenyl-diphosphate delta-isomerase
VPVPLHRAISIVIFNPDKSEILITKRSAKKPTWPYYWSNTVCSHPSPDESYQKAAERRIWEELGFKTSLREIFRFCYEGEMENRVWGENEYDVVFVGRYFGSINPNPEEVSGFEWLKFKDLKKDFKNNSTKYTPWSKIIFARLKLL